MATVTKANGGLWLRAGRGGLRGPWWSRGLSDWKPGGRPSSGLTTAVVASLSPIPTNQPIPTTNSESTIDPPLCTQFPRPAQSSRRRKYEIKTK